MEFGAGFLNSLICCLQDEICEDYKSMRFSSGILVLYVLNGLVKVRLQAIVSFG